MFESHRDFNPMVRTAFMNLLDYKFTVFIKKAKNVLGEVRACLFGKKNSIGAFNVDIGGKKELSWGRSVFNGCSI